MQEIAAVNAKFDNTNPEVRRIKATIEKLIQDPQSFVEIREFPET